MKIITKHEAIEIAEDAILGKVKRQPGAPIEVTCTDNIYTVTFVHDTPANMLGADYDAQIRIDAVTGQVVQFKVGP